MRAKSTTSKKHLDFTFVILVQITCYVEKAALLLSLIVVCSCLGIINRVAWLELLG